MDITAVTVGLDGEAVLARVVTPRFDEAEGVAFLDGGAFAGTKTQPPHFVGGGMQAAVRVAVVDVVIDEDVACLVAVVADGAVMVMWPPMRGRSLSSRMALTRIAVSGAAPIRARASGWPALMRLRRPLWMIQRVASLSLSASQRAAVLWARAGWSLLMSLRLLATEVRT